MRVNVPCPAHLWNAFIPRPRRDRARAPARASRATVGLAAGLLALLAPGVILAQGHPSPAPRAEIQVPPASETAALGEATAWLYAVDDGGDDGSSTLYRLATTPRNGLLKAQRVGETGVRDVYDIAFVGDRLFGIGPATSYGRSGDVVIEIDPDTGAASALAFVKVLGNFNALVGESANTLLAATTQGELRRFRIGSWVPIPVGDFGFGVDSAGDLALTGPGALYATVTELFSGSDSLARIDRSSGAADVVGSLGFRDAYGLVVHPETGRLMAVVDAERSPKLVFVDGRSGSTTLIGGIPVPASLTGLAVRPRVSAGCPSGFFGDAEYPDFCFRVNLGAPGDTRPGSREGACLPDTVCVSGAVPGRSELFLRILGPRPNGFLWPTIVRFTPARVVVEIRQRSTGRTNRYTLRAVPPGVDDLSGLQDREGFRP